MGSDCFFSVADSITLIPDPGVYRFEHVVTPVAGLAFQLDPYVITVKPIYKT